MITIYKQDFLLAVHKKNRFGKNDFRSNLHSSRQGGI